MRITVQLRRLARKKHAGLGVLGGGMGGAGGMTREAMRAALVELQAHTARAASRGSEAGSDA